VSTDVAPEAERPTLSSAPEPGSDERRLARGAVVTLALLSIPTAGIAYLVAGWPGAVSALLGIGLVLVLFGGSALLLVKLARQRAAGVGPLVLGAMIRLPFYVLALALLTRLDWVHGRSLAAATGLAVAVTLAVELRLMSRMPRLFWIDPSARPSTAVGDTPNDTRSDTL
jgi:hypothetical protein